MKKLGKMKLNESCEMTDKEMKNIAGGSGGGFLCVVNSIDESSGVSGWCEAYPMGDGIHPHPENKNWRLDCRPWMRKLYCGG